MDYLTLQLVIKKVIPLFTLLLLTRLSFSQNMDSTKIISHFSGAVNVTNNGISLIPTFSLGKPAAIFNLALGKGRLSFEPELRFSLEGKPWSFLFWWRYKLLDTNKFQIRIGAHPALNFRSESIATNGVTKEAMVTRRYLASELVPNYLLTKNISIGMYYLYSRGLDPGTTRVTHFITLNTNVSNIKFSNQILLRVTPQVYYLKLDKQDGVYFTSAFSLTKKNFPLSVAAIINKTVNTNITGSKDFVWNATLVYAFHKNYVEM